MADKTCCDLIAEDDGSLAHHAHDSTLLLRTVKNSAWTGPSHSLYLLISWCTPVRRCPRRPQPERELGLRAGRRPSAVG